MHAIVLQALNQVVLAQVAMPEIGDDEVLVQAKAATVCTSDLHDIAANPFGATLPLT